MDTQTLMIFVKRILAGSSVLKATSSLGQLKKILTEQGAEEKVLQLLEKIITSIPEMKQLLRQTPLTEDDVEIAHRRALDRIEREKMASRYNRC